MKVKATEKPLKGKGRRYYDPNSVLERSLKGLEWGDDAAILARVVESLLHDLDYTYSGYSIHNLDGIFENAVGDWKKYRKEQEGH